MKLVKFLFDTEITSLENAINSILIKDYITYKDIKYQTNSESDEQIGCDTVILIYENDKVDDCIYYYYDLKNQIKRLKNQFQGYLNINNINNYDKSDIDKLYNNAIDNICNNASRDYKVDLFKILNGIDIDFQRVTKLVDDFRGLNNDIIALKFNDILDLINENKEILKNNKLRKAVGAKDADF